MNPDTFELIEQYLLGQLTEADARAVEKRAKTDADFARELELQRTILKGIELAGDERIRAKIAALDRALEEQGFFEHGNTAPRAGRIFFHPFHWAAAAAILLLLGAGLWWAIRLPSNEEQPVATTVPPPPVFKPEVQKPQLPYPAGTPEIPQSEPQQHSTAPTATRYLALARDAWTPPEASVFRSTTPNAPSVLAEAWKAFQKKDYNSVMQLLIQIGPDDPNYWPASELYAHACFLSGKTKQAADRFQQIADSGQLPFSERADWYLLLCRLSQLPEGKSEFDALLNTILADEGHPFFEDARKIADQVH